MSRDKLKRQKAIFYRFQFVMMMMMIMNDNDDDAMMGAGIFTN
jgi:hypothetical protein